MKTFLFACACLFGLPFSAPAAPDATASYQSENVVELLMNYGKMTGKKILLDNTVQGKIGFVASADENEDRKVELIEKTLFLNGFTLVDAGDDVVAAMGLGKPVRMMALPLYTKPEQLPSGQRVFSYLFTLEHRIPGELVGVLAQYLPPNVDLAYTPDNGSHTLIVTGQTSVVREIIKLVAALDAPVVSAEKPGEQKPGPTGR